MFDTPEELLAHYDEKKERWEEERDHESEVVRYLGVAHDYLEEVITERESGDLLPYSTSRDVDDLSDRQIQISDRLSYHQELLDRVQDRLDRWEDDRDWEMDGHGFGSAEDAVES